MPLKKRRRCYWKFAKQESVLKLISADCADCGKILNGGTVATVEKTKLSLRSQSIEAKNEDYRKGRLCFSFDCAGRNNAVDAGDRNVHRNNTMTDKQKQLIQVQSALLKSQAALCNHNGFEKSLRDQMLKTAKELDELAAGQPDRTDVKPRKMMTR